MDQYATRGAMHRWIQPGLLDNPLQGTADLVKKLVSQTSALLLVPSCRVLEILRGLRTDTNRQAHRRLRIPASTSSNGCPGFRSASYASRRRSSSRRCASVSASAPWSAAILSHSSSTKWTRCSTGRSRSAATFIGTSFDSESTRSSLTEHDTGSKPRREAASTCTNGQATLMNSDAKSGKRSIQEFPRVCPVEAPDDDRLQKRRVEIPQVHAVTSAGRGFKRFPMRNDAAGLAPEIPERPIAPDVLFRVLGMALNGDRAKLVIGPDPSRAPAQRAIATRRGFGCSW
ncbi:MAG: hypothetical protein OJF61_001707 [Rhodanobacteraceae bacterium]|nr:MAG: hypothetical protein OJF61_001707 [Rhodanobacteraceae bacterium]